MRERGGSGLQTYVRTLHNYFSEHHINSAIVTSFSYSFILTLPFFALRRVIESVKSSWGIWWHQYWHYHFLKKVLKKQFKVNAERGVETIVYAQCPISARAALDSRKSKDQKVFMVVHFNISQANEWADKGKIRSKGSLYRSIQLSEQKVISQLDGIVYVSQFMKSNIEKNIPAVKQIRSVCLPCFTSMPSLANQKEPLGDLISVGTLDKRKNQKYLLEVVARAKQKGHYYNLTLVGDGSERQYLEQLSRKLDISQQVRFLGYQPNAASFLNSHRVYVHSSFMENMPLALIEALACQRPIVAPAVGGIPELFDDGKEGFYWPLDDVDKASEILISLMEDQKTYQSFTKAAGVRFSQQFRTENIANKLVSFLGA